VEAATLRKLLKKYPALPHFPSGRTKIKIPAGWLIEQAGFKGQKLGPVSMFEKQALVLVNHGQAEAKHVLALARKVKAAVKKKFGVDLKEEVNII
jgi:UDP-N-acetylmuramate dehydrogenase